MIVAAALLFVAEAAGAAGPSPPPPLLSPDQERDFLSRLPRVDVDGRACRLFAIQAFGLREVLDRAAARLSAEGWDCNVATDRDGRAQLGVFAQDRTLAQVQQLARRFAAQEFGKMDAKPMLFPDPVVSETGPK